MPSLVCFKCSWFPQVSTFSASAPPQLRLTWPRFLPHAFLVPAAAFVLLLYVDLFHHGGWDKPIKERLAGFLHDMV